MTIAMEKPGNPAARRAGTVAAIALVLCAVGFQHAQHARQRKCLRGWIPRG